MLSCKDLSVSVGDGRTTILTGATAVFKHAGLNAVIGPSGCGKTTLMKAMIGIIPAGGETRFHGVPVKRSEDLLGHVGFAPQFSIAHPQLTVEESIRFALDLYLTDAEVKRERLANILQVIGLEEHQAKRVGSLSGGQLRRLGLGLELTTDPGYLICDEVTSGLDPNSEDFILGLMTRLARERGKTFLCIIHNLAKLDFFDWITVVYEGTVVFQGNLADLEAYFGIPDALHLYDQLGDHPVEHWTGRWHDYRLERFGTLEIEPDAAPATANDAPAAAESEPGDAPPAPSSAPPTPVPMPGALSQFATLVHRRLLLFVRDRGYLYLTLAITLGFPVLVVIFALDGLPQIVGMSPDLKPGTISYLVAEGKNIIELTEKGSLVSGLIMFQVILLTLMGSNNGAREIAAERLIYEKERLSGLHPGAYASSKVAYVTLVSILQGFWMCFFVKMVCHFPGPWVTQAAILAGCCLSMGLLSLGFSALMASAEKASLLSIYFVGFQLPLSGVVLALPAYLVWVCRPFIIAYWAWAGYLVAMKDLPPPGGRYYDAASHNYFLSNADPFLPSAAQAGGVLLVHMALGAALAFWGCHKKQWN